MITDHFLAVLCMDLDADGVAHGAGGHEQSGFFAEDLRGTFLQLANGGIFGVDVVADLRGKHRLPHRGRGLGYGIAS